MPIHSTIQRDRRGEDKKNRKLQATASLGQKSDSRNPSESVNLAVPWPGGTSAHWPVWVSLPSTGKIPSTVINVWDKVSCDKFFGIVLQLAGRPQFPVLGTDSDVKNCRIKIFIESCRRRYGMETFREHVSKLKAWQYNPFVYKAVLKRFIGVCI